MEDNFFTIDEVSKYLKIPKSTLYKLAERKDLPSCKIGKQLRFRKSSIDTWLTEKENNIEKSPTQKARQILLIDDDKLVLKAITRFLEVHGYMVVPTESGEEALEKLQISQFDLIVTDVRMPGIDGIETIKQIRAFNQQYNKPTIPEVIITGFMDTDAKKQAEELGIDDYIYKPFATTDFIQVVEKKLCAP